MKERIESLQKKQVDLNNRITAVNTRRQMIIDSVKTKLSEFGIQDLKEIDTLVAKRDALKPKVEAKLGEMERLIETKSQELEKLEGEF